MTHKSHSFSLLLVSILTLVSVNIQCRSAVPTTDWIGTYESAWGTNYSGGSMTMEAYVANPLFAVNGTENYLIQIRYNIPPYDNEWKYWKTWIKQTWTNGNLYEIWRDDYTNGMGNLIIGNWSEPSTLVLWTNAPFFEDFGKRRIDVSDIVGRATGYMGIHGKIGEANIGNNSDGMNWFHQFVAPWQCTCSACQQTPRQLFPTFPMSGEPTQSIWLSDSIADGSVTCTKFLQVNTNCFSNSSFNPYQN